jgi:hypothetical protein
MGALGGLPRVAFWPSGRASVSCRGLRRLQGAALIQPFAVAFERGAIYPEAPCGLGLGEALLDRLDDLLPEVKRICTNMHEYARICTNMHSCINDTRRTFIAIRCDMVNS